MKYKLTDETITTSEGVVSHRIQALRDFGDAHVYGEAVVPCDTMIIVGDWY